MAELTLGRLLRSSTTGYVFGCKIPEADAPCFGDFVKAPAQRGQTEVIGLVYDLAISDDGFVRPMATADLPEEVILDQRNNRNVPIEVSVLAVGYKNGAGFIHGLPPQPPLTLDTIRTCTDDEVRAFTERGDYLRLIAESAEAPAEELLAVAVQRAAAVRPLAERERYLRRAGRELAKLLSRDLPRLERVLSRIQLNR
ncbi:MAG: hypothetical protein RMK99_14535 [Anaerolineales bacterium]|nr:hypothetical protein [Anaerolineales bacterium]